MQSLKSHRHSTSTSRKYAFPTSSGPRTKVSTLSLNLLHILVLLLSMSALDVTLRGVEAIPLASSSSAASSSSSRMDERARKARIGMLVDERSESTSESNFPDIGGRSGVGHSVPLQKLETRSSLHPQMLLQHHINRAHSKLDAMHRRQPPSQEDHQQALVRRRDLILEDQKQRRRRRSIQEQRSIAESSTDAAGFVSTKNPHGRVGVVINPDTGKAGKSSKTKNKKLARRKLDERSVEIVTQVHTVVEVVTVSAGESSSSTRPATTSAAQQTISASQKSSSKQTSEKRSTSSEKDKASAGNFAASTTKKGTASTTSTYNVAALGYPTADVDASNAEGLEYGGHPTTEGSLALDIEANDIGYIGIFDIGTAGPFRLLVDSGSADTWVASTRCTNCSSAHKQLGSTNSKTFADIVPEQDFEITYGTGHVQGHVANDTLKIGSYTLKDHTMGLALTESDDFSADTVPFDGLMGLAQSILSSTERPTPIDALYTSNLVKQPAMGYHLGRSADVNNNGQVTFGGVDGSLFKGNLTEIDSVSSEGFWEVVLDSVWFNNTEISLSGAIQRSAILDTGTTLIVAPSADAEALHQAIPGAKSDGAGGYTIPCTTSAQVEFGFGNKRWPIDARDMLFLPLDNNDLKGDCISAVSAGRVGSEGEWLIGAAFLKNVYFATNTKSNSVGMGVLTPNTNTTKSYTSNTAKYQNSYP